MSQRAPFCRASLWQESQRSPPRRGQHPEAPHQGMVSTAVLAVGARWHFRWEEMAMPEETVGCRVADVRAARPAVGGSIQAAVATSGASQSAECS